MIFRCEICGNPAVDWNHRFPQRKNYIKTYGKHLIHHPKNGQYLCRKCHENIKHMTEREYIEMMALWDYCELNSYCKKFKTVGFQEGCENCKTYKFDKERYYKDNGIKENLLILGSYGWKG